jgi:hypothetical protein
LNRSYVYSDNALDHLVQDDDVERRVRERFSAERMVQNTLDLYRRVRQHAHVEA